MDEMREGGEVEETTRARQMSRRDFFQWAAGLSIGATAALGAVTAASAINPPGRSIDGKTKMGPTPLVAVKDLVEGKPQLFEYGDDSVFIAKLPGGKLVALNAACPHVKCILHWDEKLGEFACPCHASFFKPDGARISGPAPRGMDPAIFTIANGQVVVSGFGTAA